MSSYYTNNHNKSTHISYDIVSGAHGNGYWTKLSETLSMLCGNSSCWPVDTVMVGDICQPINTTSTTLKTTAIPFGTTDSTSAIINPEHTTTTTSPLAFSETTSGMETT